MLEQAGAPVDDAGEADVAQSSQVPVSQPEGSAARSAQSSHQDAEQMKQMKQLEQERDELRKQLEELKVLLGSYFCF